MNKYTPGPWRIQNPHGLLTLDIVDEQRNLQLCRMYKYFRSDDEASANANLIAAAPDLLRALEELVKRCNLFPDADYHKAAKAAIDKAKGIEK